MNIDISELKALISGVNSSNAGTSHSFEIGACYLIRTVTMMYTGRLIGVTDSDVVLEKAAWIADSGRYANALAEGTLHEVEPYPDRVCVSRASIVDFTVWTHPLPREQK